MTTPAEKDAMALAVLLRAAGIVPSYELSTELTEARAHLAARVALLTDTQQRLSNAEAELAAVREWLAKLEAFVGPGALAYMRREFDAARGANK